MAGMKKYVVKIPQRVLEDAKPTILSVCARVRSLDSHGSTQAPIALLQPQPFLNHLAAGLLWHGYSLLQFFLCCLATLFNRQGAKERQKGNGSFSAHVL